MEIISSHPPLPPATDEERFNWLRLLRSRRVGIATFYRLLAEYGNARAALKALPETARAAGVTDYRPCPEAVIAAEFKAARAAGARLICRGEAAYPAPLHDLSDAPPALWALGDPDLAARPMVALVGARNASSLGLRMAKGLAGDLSAQGYVVVSGLARGIDTMAHRAALAGGTVAVQAGGVDVIYPPENADLAGEIARTGLRLSEQPIGLRPQARHFPARNRLISGLARAVVVIEAAAKSGSLITARTALDQGREVLAVPGHPFDARAAGCNILLRDGAVLVRNAADVIEAIDAAGLSAVTAAPAPAPELPPELPLKQPAPVAPLRPRKEPTTLHRQILDRLGPSPMAEDQLIRDLAVTPTQIAPILVELELEGRIIRQAGGLLSRAV